MNKWLVAAFCIVVAFAAGLLCGSSKRMMVRYIQNDSIPLLLHQIESLKARFPKATDTIINDEYGLVTQETDGYVNVWRRFNPKKTFEDYPVRDVYTGAVPAKLNFSTCSWGKEYKTMTQFGVDKGVRFAGYYAFAAWRCGSNCQLCSVIDMRNGNVYAGPEAGNGYDFRIDSKILSVNPPDSSGLIDPCAYCTPEQYLWTGTSFIRLE